MNDALFTLLIAGVVGLLLSAVIEQCLTPKPPLLRPWSTWALHIGVWLFFYGILVLGFGRPWFAVVIETAFCLVLMLVNNAKFKTLREPFVFHDYEYFTDAIAHPRLYIPFLGWWKVILVGLGFFLAIYLFISYEALPDNRFSFTGQLAGVVVVLLLSTLGLLLGHRYCPQVHFKPSQDLLALGLVASCWRYAQAAISSPVLSSPFSKLMTKGQPKERPHLIAVQSESFFDPRELCANIRQDVLTEFDTLKAASVLHGKLQVPAWGANTVRTEFAFLSAMENSALGVHQFNPYRALANGWELTSVASFLKGLGYQTVCIHPYPASFYQRHIVYPRLGFDKFIDLSAFNAEDKFGPYTSDEAVTKKMLSVLKESEVPIFVFVITMENHGPLHLETVDDADKQAVYDGEPPVGFDEMTVYLRHLKNADRMMGALKQALMANEQEVGLCWYGDHVPILPAVYDAVGYPTGEVDFFCWNNKATGDQPLYEDLSAHQVAVRWLKIMGLI